MKSILFALVFGIGMHSYAQGFDEVKEKAKIENTIKILVDAWARGDAKEFAAPFVKDADFTVWFGMKLNGIVTNVTDFGAFVNIGIKENGLIHKTQLADEFVANPTDFISLHDHVYAAVVSVDVERKRIGLSLKKSDLMT